MAGKQITIVVGVVKDDKGQVLVTRRNDPNVPAAHNKWEFPGGKIEFGEDPVSAVIREVKEESGLDVEVDSLVPKIFEQKWDTISEQLHVIVIVYVCKVVGGSINTVMDHKISELKFVPKEEIKNLDSLPLVNPIIELC